METRYEKIYTRAELNKKDMRQLKDICKRLKIGQHTSKAVIINHILNNIRNKFNIGDLYYAFEEITDEERAAYKENIEKHKQQVLEKKEKTEKIKKKIEKLTIDLAE